jgi:type IV pilus assembly protein PilE
MPSSKFLKGNSGFTLVELMVAVGITGALSAVAIPNYVKHVAKSRQSEAKIALSAIYVSEKQFGTEFNYYTACLNKAGFVAQSDRYYAIGFEGGRAGLHKCGATGDLQCNSISSPSLDCTTTPVGYAYAATQKMSDTLLTDANLVKPTGVTLPNSVADLTGVGKVAFSVGAAGSVSNSGTPDMWYIDQNKTLINIKSGI